MICKENGVMPGSQYFFYTPSEMVSQYFYYLLVCGHFYCQTGYNIKRKTHFAPLLMYINEGILQVEYESNQYTAKKGDIVLIDCRNPHHYYSDISTDFLFLHYLGVNSLDLTECLIKRNAGPIFQVKNYKKIHDLINVLVTKLYNDQTLSDAEYSCTIHELLCSMLFVEDSAGASDQYMLADVLDYIRKNISEPITLDTLAQQASLSPFYFSKLFKKDTGYSPIEYVSKAKIDLAKTILKTSSKSINEVAMDLGYSSCSSFINAFMLRVGISPNKFRKFPI